MLDAEEYFHLALEASKNGDHELAIERLHKANSVEPENPAVIYLLAAQHAEIGLYSRAVLGMEKALALDPNIEIARFQLGILYFQLDRQEDAVEQWEILKKSDDEAMVHFSSGMLLVLDGEQSEALSRFEVGLSLPADNPALHASVRDIVASLSSVTEGNVDKPAQAKDDSVDKSEVYHLGAYSSFLKDEADDEN